MPRQLQRATLSRRRFLETAATGLGAGTVVGLGARIACPADSESFSFGLVTDAHYADAPARGSRHYRDSLAKLTEAVETFNRRGVSFVAELGDFIDVGPAGPTKQGALSHLRTVDQVYRQFRGERYYVLGNHCMDAISKDEFLENCGASIKTSYYAFDAGGFHFVVLDADFRVDGTPYAAGNFTWTDTSIPATQQQWLAEDLDKARDRTAFVFVHQNLHDEKDPHGVRNASEVRRILESAGNVAAVFQGHMHSGAHTKIAGIHYVTLRAMVEGPGLENNAYAVVTVDRSGRLILEGIAKQPGMRSQISRPTSAALGKGSFSTALVKESLPRFQPNGVESWRIPPAGPGKTPQPVKSKHAATRKKKETCLSLNIGHSSTASRAELLKVHPLLHGLRRIGLLAGEPGAH